MTRSALVALATSLATSLSAQCPLDWTSGGPQSALSGLSGCSVLWDPDGAGPQPFRLVLGGVLLVGGDQPVNARVTTWDGTRWEALGTGPGTSGSVDDLTVWNGQLVAAGSFGGGGVDGLAAWTGSAWQPLSPLYPPGAVERLAVWNGDLVTAANGATGPTLRKITGTTLTALPAPPTLTFLHAMTSYQGLLCVAGRTTSGAGVLERWNGSTWLPSITATNAITRLAVRSALAVGATDVLYAGGQFTGIGTTAAAYIASTNGGASFAWSAVGAGLPGPCTSLHARSVGLTGYTIVASTTSVTSQTVRYSLSPLGGTPSWVAMGNARLTSLAYFGGAYHGTSAFQLVTCLRFDGSSWLPVRGMGLDGEVRALAPLGAEMVVAGDFTTDGSTALNGIARWDGVAFQALGSGITGTSVDAVAQLANGDLIAGGEFATAGGVPAANVARWNGSTWSAIGSGCNGQVLALVQMPNGDLIAGGAFTAAGATPCSHIARWNGSSWSPIGAGVDDDVRALAVTPGGVLIAAGWFLAAGGLASNHVAQWNGANWLPLGAGLNGTVHALAVRPNGDLVAVGSFTASGVFPAYQCARWNGTAWQAMGTASASSSDTRAVVVLPDGDVVAGRGFHQPTEQWDAGIARWSGTAWSGFGSGLANVALLPVSVRAMALSRSGELVVGGSFDIAGGQTSFSLAKLTTGCPASALPYGTGCNSAVGTLTIRADTLPWLGASFRTTTSGVAANTVCLGVIGFTQVAIPLQTLLPQGQPGCTLLTTPDVTMVLAPGAGTAHSVLPLADDPALVGASFCQQTVPLELAGAGAIAAIRASNALWLVIGAL